MSASEALNAPTYYTTLAPNAALPNPNFCSQSKPSKLIALNLLLKTFTKLVDSRKSRLAPNTPDSLCGKDTRHLIRFARNGSIQRSLTLDIGYPLSLGPSVVIDIQALGRRIGLKRIC